MGAAEADRASPAKRRWSAPREGADDDLSQQWIRSRLPEPGPSDHGELDDALYRLTGRLLEEETAAAAESQERVLAMTAAPDAAPGTREM